MEEKHHVPVKLVDIVQVKLVREKTISYKERRIRSPHDAYKIFQEIVGDSDREVFAIACLSTCNEVNCFQIVHIGSINISIVQPSDVMKAAILSNSASILAFHNHPSDDSTPSPEDIAITKRLVEAGEIIGIDVLDHLICTSIGFRSLKESGYM
ncbi:JAB domain-containing protein [Lysinibacillus sp. G4S2]|uniref:JAB domain-containing protein n=1 Tax=Lysinibacillus sp. G4S2 TaxID=3055859 RepID=UPI0025A02C2A|nr:JAB domain-containing protein [Lysinibacillus sp. G4S2]MDM5246427.1 JAB domain-containing protein [Lysinibacillus sp. G4S2]